MISNPAHTCTWRALQDPEFRRQFQVMCAKIGVDPLASNKGFWSEVLGVSDFYFALAVQIVDVCLATRALNGGLLSVDALLERLLRMRGRAVPVGLDDVRRAIEKLAVLRSGYKLVTVGDRLMVQSVPYELNRDHTTLLDLAERLGGGLSLPGTCGAVMRVCAYARTHTQTHHTHARTHAHTVTHTHTHTHTHTRTHTHTHTHTRRTRYTSVYVCVCVCVCSY
jgi:hypothetical protein